MHADLLGNRDEGTGIFAQPFLFSRLVKDIAMA